MRLLFLTQVLDRQDAVLGFVPRWIEGLASHVERLRVIALDVGRELDLPANVDVRCIGRRGTWTRFLRNRRFLREALAQDGFDAVLAHMVPRYTLLSAGIAKRYGARSYLWYTHGAVDRRLRRAEPRVEKIFTASAESLRLQTRKKVVTGHGIDLEHFAPRGAVPSHPPRLLAVGRMTPAKDPLCLVRALARLRASGQDVSLDLVGDVLAAGDTDYRRAVEAEIEGFGLRSHVRLHGSVPYRDIAPHYHRAAALVSASRTGSVDKVVLEAMAAQRAVFTCNDACAGLFQALEEGGAPYVFAPGDAVGLAQRLERFFAKEVARTHELGLDLRAIVERDHEVGRLMARLVREMEAAK